VLALLHQPDLAVLPVDLRPRQSHDLLDAQRRRQCEALDDRKLGAGRLVEARLLFGPIAYWVLARSGSQSFGAGIEAVSQLPTAYLILTIVIVAPAEELLYRGYAIARLSDLAGSYLLASIISVVAFGLAHVPMWGWAPAATTIVSGGIVTVVYLWRQDIVALILAHIATDLYGIVLAPHLARAVAN
jgi:membrane protease YdiL (CAAX protease family)